MHVCGGCFWRLLRIIVIFISMKLILAFEKEAATLLAANGGNFNPPQL